MAVMKHLSEGWGASAPLAILQTALHLQGCSQPLGDGLNQWDSHLPHHQCCIVQGRVVHHATDLLGPLDALVDGTPQLGDHHR